MSVDNSYVLEMRAERHVDMGPRVAEISPCPRLASYSSM